MAIEWINKKKKDGIATIANGSITLNTTAMDGLKQYQYVMIGIDKEKDAVIIKAISNNDVDRGDIEVGLLYKITVKTSYGRITSKDVVEMIGKTFNIDGGQFVTHWEDCDNTLTLDMKGGK